jgi:hypothetical protein
LLLLFVHIIGACMVYFSLLTWWKTWRCYLWESFNTECLWCYFSAHCFVVSVVIFVDIG